MTQPKDYKKNKKSPGIILALDVDTFQKARYFVGKTYPRIKIFKVGSHLFTATGPKIIYFIQKRGAEVFLDLKFFDIPNTIANAVRQATRLKIKMLTLHISGGEEMLEKAVQAARDESGVLECRRPLLIGVTVLTSQGVNPNQVLALTRKGLNAGLDGVVCSVREAAYLRKKIKNKFLIITPGIRPAHLAGDDQKRTATLAEATKAGSDFIVVGRPILTAKEPQAAIRQLR